MQRSRGFTLIELLVVIAIIGVLSSVVLASLNSARAKARDARRIADLTQIRNALEMYANDNGGRYPVQGDWRGTTPNCYNTGSDPTTAIPGLVPSYMAQLPQDPKPILSFQCYLYISNGTDYKVLAYATVEGSAVAPGQPRARYALGCGTTEASYAVYTSGAGCW